MINYYLNIFIIILFLSCQVDLRASTNNEKINSVWVYSLEEIDNITLINNIKNQGFNTAFVSISPKYLASKHNKDYQNKVLDFLNIAEEQKISIHGLICEQPTYALRKNHSKALLEVDNILRFMKNNPNAKLDGIQLDIEPHTLNEWINAKDFSNSTREDLLQDWLSLHKQIRNKLKEKNLVFSTVITWWYDSKFREGILPSGNTELLTSIVDFIVVMAFSPSLDPYKQVENECSLIPTIIGYNTNLYKSEDILNYHRNQTDKYLGKNQNYLGDCIFHLSELNN